MPPVLLDNNITNNNCIATRNHNFCINIFFMHGYEFYNIMLSLGLIWGISELEWNLLYPSSKGQQKMADPKIFVEVQAKINV